MYRFVFFSFVAFAVATLGFLSNIRIINIFVLAFARFADKRENSTRARRHKKKIENKRNVIGCVHISVRGEDCENFSFAFRDTHRYENRILNFAINSGSETFGASHIFVSFFGDSADIPHTLDTGLIIVLIISRGDSNTIPNAISPLYSPIGESEHSFRCVLTKIFGNVVIDARE